MIKSLKLTDFRNFRKKNLEFSDGVTVIVGPNASGKTNILEGLFLLSMGKSFKAKVEAEMINYDEALARVKGDGLEIMITRGENGWPRKKMLVNGVSKRLIDFAGNFKTVLFGPWDMDLVTESPSLRRKFLDTVLSQVDREYRRSILSYEKGLRQRNRLLFRIREEGLSRSQLVFWNQLLIKNGDYISGKREELIEFVNAQAGLNDEKFRLDYDKSAISEGRLEQYSEEEVAAATTLVGPHRDDFIFYEKKRDLASYGSRGEQRMAVLWLKLAELAFVEEKTGERPTLLLDDIFSELDHEHRDVVMKLAEKQQTIITTADEHFLGKKMKLEKISLGS
ncbi:MAG: replication and repair protein RecF protein [Candidatus Woesebacteria bacterium GW2011_GWB1_45_5]|uniref:DNA replication and repair protein RecF n=1 Tax=Candidatus Woesebacteria bacterium GW2011_GWB1_45_5 TaxID=1618581 RepID=A0A0G1MNV7_9BACT|nr:MAG: replication and repair protein RecF protein [Candidatus Woesebacteria bacterium GW2011_GWB1_45_5]